MKSVIKLFTGILMIGIAASCSVDKTQEGEMPDVDIQAESGELPEYDVDWANVKVSTRTKTVEVPKVVVVTEKEQVEVPYIEVNTPDDETMEERTIRVEAEVANESHQMKIKEIYADDDDLHVVAELTATGQDLQGQTVRVSDQVVINAPDSDVEYYILGSRPEGYFNTQYEFISSREELNDELEDAHKIYEQ